MAIQGKKILHRKETRTLGVPFFGMACGSKTIWAFLGTRKSKITLGEDLTQKRDWEYHSLVWYADLKWHEPL